LKALRTWLACAALAVLSPAARGESPELSGEPTASTPQPKRLRWRPEWRRVGVPEYLTTATLGVGFFALGSLVEPRDQERWSRPVLFDGAARKGLALGSRSARERAASISDQLAIASVTQPLIIDVMAVSLIADRNIDVAWQMFVIDMQSYALAGATNSLTKYFTARERPFGRGCDQDPGYTGGCGTVERYKSFYSGHAALTATSAGLVCAHHTHLPLYGGGAADTGACLGAVAFTTATGALRVASDRHWASDVLVGHLSGYLMGYLLPTLIYYHDLRIEPVEEGSRARLRIAWLPFVADNALGMSMAGMH
jgi:membrane-associated phospholipid phosphatase